MWYDGGVRRLRARRAFVFVVGVVALIDLDTRFDLRVVVAVVAALVGGERVQHADPAILFQIRIQNRAGVYGILVFRLRDGQHLDATLREHDVTLAIGVRHAALVAEQGREPPG